MICPRNQAKLIEKLPDDEFLVKVAQDFSLSQMLNMTDEFYSTRIQPLMYNYINFHDEARINEVVKIVDLERAIKDKVKTYSLGMKQRLGIRKSTTIKMIVGLSKITEGNIYVGGD